MSDNTLWKLKKFPEGIGPGPDEVQQAWQAWKYRCERDPYIGAVPVDAGGERHQVTVWGKKHPEDYSPCQQFVCDFEIHPGAWGRPGEVVYVDSGFI